MTADNLRVPIDVRLPIKMDRDLRFALTTAFRTQALQINKLSNRAVQVTADHTAAEDLVLASAGATTLTVTLAPANILPDKMISVKKTDAGAGPVKVVPASGTIDGAASQSLATQYDSIQFLSDGESWWIVSSFA